MQCARGGPRVRRRDVLARCELASHGCVRIRRIAVVIAAKPGGSPSRRGVDLWTTIDGIAFSAWDEWFLLLLSGDHDSGWSTHCAISFAKDAVPLGLSNTTQKPS